MSAITDIWRQLVRRRLWPVALLLVAALAAVPVVLAKDPAPAPPAPAPAPAANATSAKAALTTEPIVSLAGPETPADDRVPLGKRHDIFKPTKQAPKVKKPEASTADTSAGTPPAGGDPVSSGGGITVPVPPVPPAPPAGDSEPPKTYPLYSLLVRFSGGEDSGKGYLPRMTALPSQDQPLIIYLGLLDDRKTAVFLLDSTVQAIGDGECHPTPENCETVRMQEGDTMFFDVVDENGEPSGDQFQLDLLKINKTQTADAAKAAKSARLAKVSKAATLKGAAGAGIGGVEEFRSFGVVGRTG